MTREEIRAAEEADPCPFALAHVSPDENAMVSEILQRKSNFLISKTAADNLAHHVLVGLRGAHYDWHEGSKP